MIAANDTDIGFLVDMAPDQLRRVIAHAAGLLEHHQPTTAPDTLRFIAAALEKAAKTQQSPEAVAARKGGNVS